MASLEFLGATSTDTRSKFLIETSAGRLLVDCGLYQGLKARQRNRGRLPMDPASIDWVVLTHGQTADLLKVLLPDSWRLQDEEAAYAPRRHGADVVVTRLSDVSLEGGP